MESGTFAQAKKPNSLEELQEALQAYDDIAAAKASIGNQEELESYLRQYHPQSLDWWPTQAVEDGDDMVSIRDRYAQELDQYFEPQGQGPTQAMLDEASAKSVFIISWRNDRFLISDGGYRIASLEDLKLHHLDMVDEAE